MNRAPAPTPAPAPAPPPALRLLLRAGEGALLLLVFAGGSLFALILYANLPATRRLSAHTLQRALSAELGGTFSIDAVDHISPSALRVSGITVRDPLGRVVVTASVLSVQAKWAPLLRKLLFGTGEVVVRLDHARIERAEVYLISTADNPVPTIAEAFTPRPSQTPSHDAAPSTRRLKIWLPQIEIGRLYGRVGLSGVPTLETEISSVHGSLLSADGITAVDVERFSVSARGIGGADARGVGSVHVRAPGAVWTSFDGYFGEIQLGTVVRVDGPTLAVTIDVPRAQAPAARALWQAYPLQKDVGAHLEGVGTLASMRTQGKFSIGTGSIDESGELRLSDNPGADLSVSAHSVDLRAIWPTLPETLIDADATVSAFEQGGSLTANVIGSTRATSIVGVPFPAVDVNGSYTEKGFDARASIHEPGAPLEATFLVRPDGSVDGTVEAKHVDLSRAPRLAPYFKGGGTLDLQLKARIQKEVLDATFEGTVHEFSDGALSIDSTKLSGRARGPLGSPSHWLIDATADSHSLRIGGFGLDALETKASGPVLRPLLSATVDSQSGPSIKGTATLSMAGAPRLDGVKLRVERDRAALTANVARVEFSNDEVRVGGLSLQGAGGKLEASAELGSQHVGVQAHGSGLDLGSVAQALGLPRGSLSGKAALDADLDSSRKAQRGKFSVALDHGQLGGVAVTSLELAGDLNTTHVGLNGSATLRDFGDFVGQVQATVNGSLGDRQALERATGTLTLKGEHLPLGLLSYVLPKSAGISEVRGQASATLELNRQTPTAIPSASLVANTTGLYVALNPKAEGSPTVIQGVDAHAGLNVNGDTGQSDLTLKLDDRHGALISATTNLTLNLETARSHPRDILEQLYRTPLVAKAVVEDRPLEELPAPLVPKGVAGRLRSEASLSGTLERPVFSDKTELAQLRFGDSERDKAIDVCAQLDYDKSTGRYGGRGELFLPSGASRACKGTRVAQFSGAGQAEWDRLVHPNLSADAAWTGTVGLSLEGLPLDVVPALAEAGFDGRVLGVVMFDRRQALPQMYAQLEIRDAIVARTRLGTASVQARSDGRNVSANLSITEPIGKLTGDLQAAVNWQGVVPNLDDTRPISGHLVGSNLDAVILTPLVRDVFSEIGGKLDTQLTLTLTPDLDAHAEQHWTGAVNGSLSMHDGTLQLARLALRMKNVSFSARAEEHTNTTLITVDSMSAAAEAERANVAAGGNIWLDGFRLSKGNARATLRGVPLLVEGVTLATLDGENISVDLERRANEMFVGLTIPELNAQLPQSGARSLISLGENASVEIAQPIAEPRQASDSAALPWRIKFDLGNKVKVTRSDLSLPITGSPELILGDELQVDGDVELTAGGRLNLPGLPRPFIIESGTLSFDTASDPSNPRVSVQAVCETSQITVRAKVSGTFRKAHIDLEDVDDPGVTDQATILAKLLNAPTDETTAASNTGTNPAAAAGLGAGAGFLGSQLLANTPLSNLELKAGSETTADQHSYQTYSAAYPLSDTLWFEGSYKTLQSQDVTSANANAFSGTFDWRFRRNWSLRTEVGNIGAGVDLLWQYKY